MPAGSPLLQQNTIRKAVNLYTGSYLSRAKKHRASRMVNMFIQKTAQDDNLVIYSTPGVKLEASNTELYARGIHQKYDYMYVVLDNTVYKVDSSFSKTSIGTLSTSVGRVNIASNNNQIIFHDGSAGYVYNLTDSTFESINDSDFIDDSPTIATLKERVFAHSNQQFYYSELADASTWNALSFYTAESIQQEIVALYSFDEKLFVFGESETEIWQTQDSNDDPLSPIDNLTIRYGCAAKNSIAANTDNIFYLGRGKNGKLAVVKVSANFVPEPVSDQGLTFALKDYSHPEDATAFCWQFENKEFYQINFTTDNKSWLYDIDLQVWTELEYNNSDRHPADQHVYFNNKNMIISHLDGNLYSLDNDTFTDNGTTIHRKLVSPVLDDEFREIYVAQLLYKFEPSTTLHTGVGSEPSVSMRFSNDGGFSYSAVRERRIGKVGEYKYKTRFLLAAHGDDLVIETVMHDPVRWALVGVYANLDTGIA